CAYTISIQTGCVDRAGTDANIDIFFSSFQGRLLPFYNIDNKDDNFEKCQLDTFDLHGDCLPNEDKICRMIIERDNSGRYQDWYIDWIQITGAGDGPQKFNVDAWLDNVNRSKEIDLCNG
ncbi:hypothetical protein SELMODRAFT_73713, partial [Selaginella moellendorffii]